VYPDGAGPDSNQHPVDTTAGKVKTGLPKHIRENENQSAIADQEQ